MSDLSNFLEEVYQRLTPEQVYEGTFDHKWHKAGSKWRGECPWHDSKSGTAFYINSNNLTWYCPACAIGGGPVQYRDRLSGGSGSPRGKRFVDLLKQLGEQVNLQLPERELTPEQAELERKIENRRAILSTVVLYGQKVLASDRGAQARQYLSDRGFAAEDITNLGLGLYLSASEVRGVVEDRGFAAEDIQETGVASIQKNGEINRALEGYIIIPWNDENGRLLSFYGRYQAKEPPEGKPKTTSLRNPGTGKETWLRSKRSPLYFDRARAAGHRDLIVVEGVFDAALLQSRGDSRVIAWVAANPSGDQIETLARCKVSSVTFCLDPDGAGTKGTLGGIKHLAKVGITPYVAPTLPEGLDPDEFVNQFGIDGWQTFIDQSQHGFKFQAQAIVEHHKTSASWSDRELSEVLEEAIAFDRSISHERRRADLNAFFWPEFKTLTGVDTPSVEMVKPEPQPEPAPVQRETRQRQQQGEAPDFHSALDFIDQLEAAIEDDDELEDAAARYVAANGLRVLGWNGANAIARARRRRDREDAIELIEVHELLARHHGGRKWLISALIPLGSVIGLVSPGGGGKSSFIYDLVRHLATGDRWNGFKVRKCKILVIQIDEPEIDAHDKLDIANFYEVPYGSVHFVLKWRFSQMRQLKRLIREHKFQFVVIDSLTAGNAGSGIDQNDTRSGDPIYELRDVANAYGCTFLVIHHCNAVGGVRGSTTFRDNVSELWLLLAGDGNELKIPHNQRVLWHNKSRAGLMGEKILLQQNALDYSWLHCGSFDGPNPATWGGKVPFITEATVYLESNPNLYLSASQLASHFNQRFETAQLELEKARRLGLIGSEWVQHHKPDGKAGRFRVYFAAPEEDDALTLEAEIAQEIQERQLDQATLDDAIAIVRDAEELFNEGYSEQAIEAIAALSEAFSSPAQKQRLWDALTPEQRELLIHLKSLKEGAAS